MGYLAAAFIVVWALVTLYLVYMGRRQRQLEQDVETLRAVAAEKYEADSE